MTPAPVIFTWSGEAMQPLPRFKPLCDRQYAVHETYTLVPHEARSRATHNHFFACVYDAWVNLPDDLAMQFLSAEHLRKWALIDAGYANERAIACASKLEARKVAAFITPMDEYAVVTVRGETVKVFTAQSQSMKAMGKKVFQESKQAVLDIVSRLIGVSADELSSQVKAAPSSPALGDDGRRAAG